MIRFLLLFSLLPGIIFAQDKCREFLRTYTTAVSSASFRRNHEKFLQSIGFIMHEGDIGYVEENSNLISFSENLRSDHIETLASMIADRNRSDLNNIDNFASCIGRRKIEEKSWPKYRAINGYGNNLKNPHWGATGSPFGRYGPKNYDDGVHAIRKSVTGSELPSPHDLVQNVLLKAKKTPWNATEVPNAMLNLIVLYITHDLAHMVPVEAYNNDDRIRCCTHKNQDILPRILSHSSCLPISIGVNDSFYSSSGVRCLNVIRAEQSSLPSRIQYGEILNKATAYMDHSLIYGVEDSELKGVRSYSNGKLNLGPKNILPITRQGSYIRSSDRLRGMPLGALFAVMFSRLHNNLAEGLKNVNPQWNDETLFQESRRINIAIFQRLILLGRVIESVAKKRINETYKETFDASTTLEFSTASYRFLHYFLQPDMRLEDENKNVERILLSDSAGRFDIIENRYDDVLRGTLNQPANFGEYTEEIFQRFAKNDQGIGINLLAIDIQRGRDHGLPTFLATRRACGLDDLKTFEDLMTILPEHSVNLLKKMYESPEDIDLYVGGALESWTTVQQQLVGATFGCIIGDQYRHTMGGDAYFFNHKTNPYPFTQLQIDTIESFTVNHLLCTTTGLKTVQANWAYVESKANVRVPCSSYKPLDLTPWKV